MNENLKTTIDQKLDGMTDETARQLLDYIEYLESKFNRSMRERTTLERIAENVEGTLRSNPIGEAAIKGTGGIIDAAGSVARGVAAAGQAVFDEIQLVVTEEAEEEPQAEGSGDEKETDGSAKDEPKESLDAEDTGEKSQEGGEDSEKTSA